MNCIHCITDGAQCVVARQRCCSYFSNAIMNRFHCGLIEFIHHSVHFAFKVLNPILVTLIIRSSHIRRFVHHKLGELIAAQFYNFWSADIVDLNKPNPRHEEIGINLPIDAIHHGILPVIIPFDVHTGIYCTTHRDLDSVHIERLVILPCISVLNVHGYHIKLLAIKQVYIDRQVLLPYGMRCDVDFGTARINDRFHFLQIFISNPTGLTIFCGYGFAVDGFQSCNILFSFSRVVPFHNFIPLS
mmetsp:Transcript_20037/g.42178  ORF Transcript_20037/g.42178 Transcript_20037/m.42178 type:complete len:244 (-) Transcript_20037:571-1302(-)